MFLVNAVLKRDGLQANDQYIIGRQSNYHADAAIRCNRDLDSILAKLG